MKIPIRHSFIGLILLMEACLLIKGEECWIPMICDDQPTWRELTEGQCTKEEEKALEALTERLDGMKSELNQLEKVLEESETNSVQPSVVGVKEMTNPQGNKVKNTTRSSTVPATSPWSTKEAFLSTVLPQTTKVEQSTVTVRTCPVPEALENGIVDTTTAPDLEFGQTIEYSCNAGYVLQGSNMGKCGENGTWGEVPTCVVDLTCDFESSTNPTCGYMRFNGTFERTKDITGYVLAGNGTIRSLPKALAGNEELCMSVDLKGTSDGELVAKAHNGTVTKAIWPFSASTTWKTEKFVLKKANSTDTEVQLELEASGNVELDNITTLNSSECYGLATPCAKRNLENGKIFPEQELYSEDQKVSYSCSNGYILEGRQTGTCKADGSWSTTPACTLIQCVKQNLEKGTISPEQELYNQDQEVSYSCNYGYTLEGGQTGTCKADGSWSKTPVCTPTQCTKRNLEKGTISPEQDLYSQDQEVSYSCNYGYTLEGGQTGICKADGSWSTTPACTIAIQCVKRNLEKGTISPEQELYNQNQEVSYSCNYGFTLEGGQTGTCKADGSWSTTPVCTKCGVEYNLKCFRAIVYNTHNVTLRVAETLCKNKLANIYDVTHYKLIQDYLRPMIPDGESHIWDGQLYSTTGQAMSLPTEVWRNGYPYSDASYTTVVVVVNRNPDDQGISNVPPFYLYHGAICEIEL
uniref:sushi, von Willebrand factor type A, EGF and pentraxin domain-containing protein 1-like isoform X2 n=1 Tax=Styela clava TaxID=7725 RepID=UPI0019397A12|nr:sushi, von Willebrand factor type A, EGF and pentraxin domain-containing protein 1-like isoform X2 [Styela clava]